MLPLTIVLVAGALHGLVPVDGAAQLVRGRVVSEVNEAPVEGMFMTLADHVTGERVGAALTDASGLFMIRTEAPGTFRLRGERMGLRSVADGPFVLSSGSSPFVELATAPEAIVLEGLEIEGEERCKVDPEVGSATARVWEEVRKALDVVAWSSESGLYEYSFNRFERELDASGRRVQSESERSFTGWSKNPYVSVDPEQLAVTGFATGRSGSRIFFAPDANVLMSGEFLAGHCFRLTREETDAGATVGLAFEPVRRTGRVDIEGVLWLDSDTGLLARVEFRYLNFDPDIRSSLVGGTVEFQRLESGAWIVPSWNIRLPMIGIRARGPSAGSEHILVGIREEGGDVVRIMDMQSEGRADPGRLRGRISGLVFDSTAVSPLVGARVYVSGTSYAAVTDNTGGFEMIGLRAGEYRLAVAHPRLDSLGITVSPRRVVVGPGTASRVQLIIPTVKSALAEGLCPPSARSDTTSVLVGIVRDQGTGLAVAEATVRVTARSWSYQSPSAGGLVRQQSVWQETQSDADGGYAFCQVPPDESLQLEANHADRKPTSDSVRSPRPGDVVQKDLEVPFGPRR